MLVLLLYMQSVWTHDFRNLIEKMKENKTGGTAGRIADNIEVRVIQTKLEQESLVTAERKLEQESLVTAERKLEEAQTLLEQCDQNRM